MVTPFPAAELDSPVRTRSVKDTATVEERRASGRIRTSISARLNGVGYSAADLTCTAMDIGAGGMFVRAAASSGLAVGQRFEVTLPARDAETSPLAQYLGESCYATVVRTERLRSKAGPVVGGGLRFDQPLAFWHHSAIV